jgi:hypothetical protein
VESISALFKTNGPRIREHKKKHQSAFVKLTAHRQTCTEMPDSIPTAVVIQMQKKGSVRCQRRVPNTMVLIRSEISLFGFLRLRKTEKQITCRKNVSVGWW